MDELPISIINYRTRDLTGKSVKSVLKYPPKCRFKIYLIDNNSEDGSLEYLETNFKDNIEFIRSETNLGFGKGHNLVLKKAKSDFVVILNSDAEVFPDTLQLMVQFMKDNSDVGVASCKVIGFDNELQPNGGDLPLGLALINWLFNLEVLGIERPSFHRVESEYYNSVHQVGWVSGNFMIIRTEALKKAGYFDSDYFMYFEDVDLCYMMAESGYKVMINPDVRIKHLSGGSLDHPQFRQWKGEFWGLIHFYRKRFGFLSGLIISTLVYISILLRILAFAAIGKFEYSKTYAKVFASI